MERFEQIIKIILGNFLMAFAVNMFIIPFSFISGGSTGLALIIQHFVKMDFSVIVSGINIIMFTIGFICLGQKFALTTLLSTIIYPLFIEWTMNVSHIFELTHDPLVACVLGGILMGCALGLIIQSGASSGGLDIPPLLIEKYFHVNVAISLYIIDTVLIFVQMLFSSLEGILCGCIMIFLTSFVMNRILTFGKSQCQVMIISEKFEEIRNKFIHDLDKGTTLFMIETGYYKKNQKALCSIVSQKDLSAIKETILSIDKNAFMIVSKVQEVRGLGFKPWDKIRNTKI